MTIVITAPPTDMLVEQNLNVTVTGLTASTAYKVKVTNPDANGFTEAVTSSGGGALTSAVQYELNTPGLYTVQILLASNNSVVASETVKVSEGE